MDEVNINLVKLLLVLLRDNHLILNKYKGSKLLSDLEKYDYVREYSDDGYKLCATGQYFRSRIIDDALTKEEEEQLSLVGKYS